MKIDNPIHNTSFTPTVPATSSEASAASSTPSGADFANVLEENKSADLSATRITKTGDTLIGIVRDEAKAKAAEAAAKTAHGNKVADFQLCKSREKVAAHYYKTAKASGKPTNPPVATPACADPGPFVAAAPAAPAAVAAAPAAAAKPAAPGAAPAAAAPAKKS